MSCNCCITQLICYCLVLLWFTAWREVEHELSKAAREGTVQSTLMLSVMYKKLLDYLLLIVLQVIVLRYSDIKTVF